MAKQKGRKMGGVVSKSSATPAIPSETLVDSAQIEKADWRHESWSRWSATSSEQMAYVVGRLINAFQFHGKQFVMLAFRGRKPVVEAQRRLAQAALAKLECCVEQLLPKRKYWPLRRQLKKLVANWHVPHDPDPDFLFTLFTEPEEIRQEEDRQEWCDTIVLAFPEVATEKLADRLEAKFDRRHKAILRLGVAIDRLVRPASVHRRLFDERKFSFRCPAELAKRFDVGNGMDIEEWYARRHNRFANTPRRGGELSSDEDAIGKIETGLQTAGLEAVITWLCQCESNGLNASTTAKATELGRRIWGCYVPRPQFLAATGELFFRGKRVKQFRGQPADNQRKILLAFEDKSWARSVPNPLMDAKIEAHKWKTATQEAVRELKRNSGGVVFRVAEQCIVWEAPSTVSLGS